MFAAAGLVALERILRQESQQRAAEMAAQSEANANVFHMLQGFARLEESCEESLKSGSLSQGEDMKLITSA